MYLVNVGGANNCITRTFFASVAWFKCDRVALACQATVASVVAIIYQVEQTLLSRSAPYIGCKREATGTLRYCSVHVWVVRLRKSPTLVAAFKLRWGGSGGGGCFFAACFGWVYRESL